MESIRQLSSAILLALGICVLFQTADGQYSQSFMERCRGQSRGQFPHFKFCNWYYNCWDGQVFEQKCGDDTVFNGNIRACDYPSSVDCNGRPIAKTNVEPPATWRCPQPDGTYPDLTDCSAYYVCRSSQQTRFKCGYGQLFNAYRSQCSQPINVNCGIVPDPTGMSSQYFGDRNPNLNYPPGSYPQPGTFGGGYVIGNQLMG